MEHQGNGRPGKTFKTWRTREDIWRTREDVEDQRGMEIRGPGKTRDDRGIEDTGLRGD